MEKDFKFSDGEDDLLMSYEDGILTLAIFKTGTVEAKIVALDEGEAAELYFALGRMLRIS